MESRRWWPNVAVIIFLACAFAAVAPGYIHRFQIPLVSATGIYLCFLLEVILLVIPGTSALHAWRPNPIFLPVLWCLPYLAYAAGTGDFRWLALGRLLLVSSPLPLLYGFVPVRDLKRFNWQDLVAAAWLISVVLSNQLKGIWTVPANLDFMGRLFLISLAAWTWTFVRRVPELGYDFRFGAKTFQAAGTNFGWFALIAIPASLALRFTEWNPRWQGVASFCADYLSIFLFIALLEELFFRGFLQTLISVNLKSAVQGQLVVACLFGLFHILHAPFPNWRYVLLASVAGWFYGSAFRSGGNLMASSLTHATVDTLWRTLFSKG